MTHQLICLFAPAAATYYPDIGNIASTYYGVNNTADAVFYPGNVAVLRSALISNTSSGSGTVEVQDTSGNTVLKWTTSPTVGAPILFGPDGVEIDDGFKIVVTGANNFFTLVYDKK